MPIEPSASYPWARNFDLGKLTVWKLSTLGSLASAGRIDKGIRIECLLSGSFICSGLVSVGCPECMILFESTLYVLLSLIC
jgi:hypothetical protein